MRRIVLALAAVGLTIGCASSIKREDGSKVPKQSYVCGENTKIAVSLHANVAHLYLGMKQLELPRQAMRDGMIIFSNDKAELAYKTAHPQLALEGKEVGDCVPAP